jgi:uncharacterized HAD superfamily protein
MVQAIMVDIDGTLAHMKDRSPYDYSKVHEDELDQIVASITRHYKHVVVMSGRPEDCREATEKWLRKHDVRYDALFMRPTGDTRQDQVVKWELYQTHVQPHYQIDFVLDDRNRVVKMWRENGLKCLQVAEGDF